MNPIHSNVFPFNRKRAAVPYVVQRDDDFFEANVSVADGTKIPISPVISKVGVTAKDADFACSVPPPDIFHVRVVDAVAELAQEFDITDALVAKMGRVVVEAKPAMISHSLQGAVRRRISNAISVGCTSSAKFTSYSSKASRIGRNRLPKSSNPFWIKSWLVGGNA